MNTLVSEEDIGLVSIVEMTNYVKSRIQLSGDLKARLQKINIKLVEWACYLL